MNYTQLSLDQAPGIATPMRFLLSAPLFAILASVLLIVYGPEILTNRWLPQTLAVTHLITLGFITMSMMGAIFQLLPVLAGSSFPKSSIASSVIHISFTLGVICLAPGFIFSNPALIKYAIILLSFAFIIFLAGVSFSLYKAQSRHASVTGMKYSIIALWIALLLGIILASGHGWQDLPLLRQYTEMHIAWAGIGWITLMTIAVAYQVIPMFQVTDDYPAITRTVMIPGIFTALIIWSLSSHLSLSNVIDMYWLSIFMEWAIALFLLFHITVSIRLQLQRKKRLRDSSLYFWLTGLISLGLCIIIYLYNHYSKFDFSMQLGLLFFAGFAISIINGMFYKIIPFLIWLHLNRRLVFSNHSLGKIPVMNEIIHHKYSYIQFLLHIAALLTTTLALSFSSDFYYAAAILWLFNWCLLFLLIIKALLIYKKHLQTN